MPMNPARPPARDYVPRRSGEIAASLLQAYAFFHHNTYDAEGVCFVPGNVHSDAGQVVQVTWSANRRAEAQSCFGACGLSAGVPPLAAFSPARMRRCTSACRYLRRLSGTMPGDSNSRSSETLSCGRYERSVASDALRSRMRASRALKLIDP